MPPRTDSPTPPESRTLPIRGRTPFVGVAGGRAKWQELSQFQPPAMTHAMSSTATEPRSESTVSISRIHPAPAPATDPDQLSTPETQVLAPFPIARDCR